MTPRTIEVSLTEGKECNELFFALSSDVAVLDLDEENNGEQIKKLFAQLLEEMTKYDITLVPQIPKSKESDLYGEVSLEYIKHLNDELERIKPKLSELLSEEYYSSPDNAEAEES